MNANKFYDQLSSKDQYRLSSRKNLLSPQFPRSLFAFENRFAVVISEIIAVLSKQKAKTVILDVGCGDGVYEKYFIKSAPSEVKIIGVDVSKKQLNKAARYFHRTYQVDLDTESLPLKKESVDIVICSEMLEHVFYPEKTINEIRRVLKPGGYLLFTTPNVASMQTRLSLLFGGFSPMINYSQNKEHIRFYSLRDIKLLFQDGFSMVKVRGIGSALFDHWNSNFKIIFPRLFQIIGDHFLPGLANGFLIVAKKK